MTPEQELTAMIEEELSKVMVDYCLRNQAIRNPKVFWRMDADQESISEMPEPDRQNAALRKLYWLATDPDEIVH